MAVLKFEQEVKVKVPAKRMFKAFVTETFDLLPKILPDTIKSIDILEGDGVVKAGTVRQTNFAQGYMKHRIDEIDADNCTSKYTLIEGPVLGDKIESVFYDQKYEDTPDGGCIIKIAREVRVKDGVELNEEEVKDGEKNALAIYTQVEEYLLAHPEVCA